MLSMLTTHWQTSLGTPSGAISRTKRRREPEAELGGVVNDTVGSVGDKGINKK